MDPRYNDKCLCKRKSERFETETEEKAMSMQRQTLELCSDKPRKTKDQQPLEARWEA